jgi:hypothetical protein
MPIQPFSWAGLSVLGIFVICMSAIILEAPLQMEKFKPALCMLAEVVIIGLYYAMSGDDPRRFEPLAAMQARPVVQHHRRIELRCLVYRSRYEPDDRSGREAIRGWAAHATSGRPCGLGGKRAGA